MNSIKSLCIFVFICAHINVTKLEKKIYQGIDNSFSPNDLNVYLNYGSKKFIRPINIGKFHKLDSSQNKSKVDILSTIFRNSVQKIRHKNKRIDVVFLIDSSSSVGKFNFVSEIKFVKKMLSDFNVSYNHTRVAIVTFSSHGKIVS